uniref:Uncharacterized protein n=1 Tax=Plectus sambesii TaxID=2011161 RepID=A0A914WVI8_9BILA
MQPSYMELQVAEEDDYYKLILIYKYDRPVGAGNWGDINNTDLVLIVFQLLPQPYGRGVFWPLSFYPVHPRLLDNLIWSRNEFVKDKDEILPNLASYRGEMNGADDGSNICFGGDADEMTRRGYHISQLYMRARRKEVLENNVSPAFNDSFNCMHL